MARFIGTLAVLCIAEGLFELLFPESSKKQLKTVCGILTLTAIIRLVLTIISFG